MLEKTSSVNEVSKTNDETDRSVMKSERKNLKNSKTLKSQTALRYQINASPGLIPYNKQSARKFVFEKCCPVNE